MTRDLDEATAAFVATCDDMIAECQSVLDRFADKIRKNPGFALSSCDDLISAGAEIRVWTDVRDALAGDGNKATLATIHQYASRELMRHAEHPCRSTSVTSNLAHQCAGAAWAGLLSKMRWAGLIDLETGAFKAATP